MTWSVVNVALCCRGSGRGGKDAENEMCRRPGDGEWTVWLLTAPDRTRPIPGQKWLIISLQRRITRRNKSELSAVDQKMNTSRRSWWVGFNSAWTYSMFPAYSVEAKRQGFETNATTRETITSAYQKHELRRRRLRSGTGPVRSGGSGVARCG